MSGQLTLITHPETGVSLCKAHWAKELGITQTALSYRLKNHSLLVALTSGTLPFSKQAWSEEEDDYLSLVCRAPNIYKHWNIAAKKRGWRIRSYRALCSRIYILQHKGEIDGRQHLEESDGWLTMRQLSQCMDVSPDSIRSWMRCGLKVIRNNESERSFCKIHLKDFVLWACTPNGAGIIGRAIYGNAIASTWLLVQVGNWMPEAVKSKHKKHKPRIPA